MLCLVCVVHAVSQEPALPRVEDRVAVAYASQPARSHHCRHGTEFLVTLGDDALEDGIVDAINTGLTESASNVGRLLQPDEANEGQLKALSVCLHSGVDIEAELEKLRNVPGVEAIEQNAVVELQTEPWHLDRIDQV